MIAINLSWNRFAKISKETILILGII